MDRLFVFINLIIISIEKIKEILTNEKYFFERFNSLSIDAQQFYRSLYSIGRVGLPLKDQ